jgi:hypothetical protein
MKSIENVEIILNIQNNEEDNEDNEDINENDKEKEGNNEKEGKKEENNDPSPPQIRFADIDEQRVNHEIYINFRHHIGKVIIALLSFAAITYLLVYIYVHRVVIVDTTVDTSASVLKKVVTAIINAIETFLFYYTMCIRFIAIITTGVGCDIQENACRSSWPRVNANYASAFNLDKNVDYTSAPSYYDFCMASSNTLIYTFLVGHLSIIMCAIAISAFCSLDVPVRQAYMNMVNRLNTPSSSSSSTTSTWSYEYLNRRRLKPMNADGLDGVSRMIGTLVYVFLSFANYILRTFVKGGHNVYINLPVLLIGMFIAKLASPFIALKYTPFEDWDMVENINNRDLNARV